MWAWGVLGLAGGPCPGRAHRRGFLGVFVCQVHLALRTDLRSHGHKRNHQPAALRPAGQGALFDREERAQTTYTTHNIVEL